MTAHLFLGEWWQSNALFGGVFFFVAFIIFGLAWYVLRGDRLNRIGIDDDLAGSPHGDGPEDLTSAQH